MWTVVAIAGIIGLIAILRHHLRHYLTSSKSHADKPQSEDMNQNNAMYTQEAMMSNFEAFDAFDVLDYRTIIITWVVVTIAGMIGWAVVTIAGIIALVEILRRRLHRYLTSSESYTDKPQSEDKNHNEAGCTQETISLQFQGSRCTSHAFDAMEWRKPILTNVMEALADPNTHLIGVYGPHEEIKDALLQRVCRRVHRDELFGMVLTTTITEHPDMRKIQEDIARQLGFTFSQMSKDKRANELNRRIKNERKILIVLLDLCKGLDLRKVGIPYGADHTGCKILLTSTTEDVLSNQMHAQKTFLV